MKIVVIGASGKIGSEIVTMLEVDHEVIKVGRSAGDIQADYADAKSTQAMFEKIGGFDALISVAGGDSVFKDVDELDDADFAYGFERKLLGQIRLLRLGAKTANKNAGFLFSSGFLSHYPNRFSLATGPFNAAIDTYVQQIAPMLPNGIRAKVVSPAPVVPEDRIKIGLISARTAAEAYVEALDEPGTGQIVRAWGGLET